MSKNSVETKQSLYLQCDFNKTQNKNMKNYLKSKINQTVNSKIMAGKVFKTPYREEQEAKDLAVYNEWNELMKVPGQSASGVAQHLMQKYGIHSQSTIWCMRQRAEKRLKAEGKL